MTEYVGVSMVCRFIGVGRFLLTVTGGGSVLCWEWSVGGEVGGISG